MKFLVVKSRDMGSFPSPVLSPSSHVHLRAKGGIKVPAKGPQGS